MAKMPVWFTQLNWQGPCSIHEVNADRTVLPEWPGLYVFTADKGPLRPGEVLYIGETGQKGGLRARVASYLVNWRIPKDRESHKGKGFVLEYRSVHGDQNTFLRWVEYGGSDADRHMIEASLIEHFSPQMNDRLEYLRHPVLADDERLDPRLLG